MIKYIGQHIFDFIARFRSDVYLEDLSTSTDINVLVVDSDGKVFKNANTSRTFQITVPGYVAGITDNTNYYHRQSTSFLNWSGGVDADPSSAFPAADLVTNWFTMPYNGSITRVRIQGVSNTTDPFKFHIFKGAASSNATSLDLTQVGFIGDITPDTADRSYEYNAATSFVSLSAGDRIYVFFKKTSGSGSVNNYYNISIEGKYTS